MSTCRLFQPLVFSLLIALPVLLFAPAPALGQHVPDQHQTDQAIAVDAHQEATHDQDHDGGLDPLFFIILALVIGAGTRDFLRKNPLPFTVLLFLLGLGIGALNRLGFMSEYALGSFHFNLDFVGNSIDWAAHIDPHLLLFVFLPILIFEAAFAMDVHTFKKTVVNAVLLAVPGIVIALLLTGAIAIGMQLIGLGLNGWNWPIAFMFGAVVSATDPVAVVAILKELGASKKLGTLIEGESLLNDGTAIVFFMAFFLSLTGAATDTNPVLGFLQVSLGGVAVGLLVGYACIRWVKRVFNDAMVEISVIIAAAYLTFYVAEHFFHVSGVLALVSLGLLMAGPGRTSLSPEVEHFLHEFWELAVFIANILIFLIVGIVVANRTVFTLHDFALLGILYAGIFAVRALVIALLYPFMQRAGYGINRPFAVVAWWGALRGAIGLALALIVANAPGIEQGIRDQFLFLTAGIVMLTLLVNATTMKWVVSKLGLTRIAPAKAMMMADTYRFLETGTNKAVEDLKNDRFLRNANWNVVNAYKPDYSRDDLGDRDESTGSEIRRRVLEKEKNSYWRQFKDGMLGATAVRNLSDQIDTILDHKGEISLADRADLEESWQTPRLLHKMQQTRWLRSWAQRPFFNRLAVSYECARGFVAAQEEALKLLSGIQRSKVGDMTEAEEAEMEAIENEINENRIHGLTFLRNMRHTYPDVYNAIATRQAVRSMLNYERSTVDRLFRKGRIEKDEASRMFSDIELRMKKLMDTPHLAALPTIDSLLKPAKWLDNVSEADHELLCHFLEERVFSVRDQLIAPDSPATGLFIVARGHVALSINGTEAEVAGPGQLVGAYGALCRLSGVEAVAESPVTALYINRSRLKTLLKTAPTLADSLWTLTGQQLASAMLPQAEALSGVPQQELQSWLHHIKVITGNEAPANAAAAPAAILLAGHAQSLESGEEFQPPAVMTQLQNVAFGPDARVVLCGYKSEVSA